MLPTTGRRLLNYRSAVSIRIKLLSSRLYSTSEGTPPRPRRPAHVSPKDWRRTQKIATDRQVELPSRDTPEVAALKTRLVNATNIIWTEYSSVHQIAEDYRQLQQTDTPLPISIITQTLRWCCRAQEFIHRRIAKDKTLNQNRTIRGAKATLQSLIDEFTVQCKQEDLGASHARLTIILRHYYTIGEFGKALKLWDWLCSMKHQGYQNPITYAIRIEIANSLDEGYDVCKKLFEEGSDTIDSDLARYCISDNASLLDPTKPTPDIALQAIPLLKAMFSAEIRYGHWQEAYLHLDTILRLNPMESLKDVRYNVVKNHPALEAFLIECLEVHSGALKGKRTSHVVQWLLHLVPSVTEHSNDQDIGYQRLYSVACTLIESLKVRYQAQILAAKGQQSRRDLVRDGDLVDLRLLWTCWSKLNHLHGRMEGQTPILSQNMVDFVTLMLTELPCEEKGSQSLLAYIQQDNDVISKLEDKPEKLDVVSVLLVKLSERISQFLQSRDEISNMESALIPYWSDLFTKDEMFDLYDELGFNGRFDKQTASKMIISDGNDELAQNKPVSYTRNFIYETKTGLPFAKARFNSWWTMNILYLTAHAFEQAECLYRHEKDGERMAETAAKQAKVLEVLNMTEGLSEQERKEKKQVLLEVLRDWRRHRGESYV